MYGPGKINKIEEKILILWNKFVNQCKFYLGTVLKRWSYKEVSVLNEFILKTMSELLSQSNKVIYICFGIIHLFPCILLIYR